MSNINPSILNSIFLRFGLAVVPVLTAAEPNLQNSSVPPIMYEFLGEIMRLQPFMTSESAFTDSKNSKEISARLKNLADISSRLPHSKRLNSSGFSISADAVRDHLLKLKETFATQKLPQKRFARMMLLATLDGCSSCHSQVPGNRTPQWKFKENELQGSELQKAEFLFAVRHYDEALLRYNKIIRAYDPKHGHSSELGTALRRKLSILTRSKQNPAEAEKSLTSDLRNTTWPKTTRAEVQDWVSALKKITPPKSGLQSAEALEALASSTLPSLLTPQARGKSGSQVMFLYVSGLIFQFINTHSEEELTPGLLYWLAICDLQLNRSFFFNFADAYLKECIVRFRKSPVARKCFAELEATTLDAYTGSAGVNLPDEVRKDLEKYRVDPEKKSQD